MLTAPVFAELLNIRELRIVLSAERDTEWVPESVPTVKTDRVEINGFPSAFLQEIEVSDTHDVNSQEV